MATRLEETTVEAPAIPYEEFTDGCVWEIDEDEAKTYSTGLTGFRRTLYTHARRHSLTLSTRIDGNTMRFQFKEKK
ncbi:hypothetical protein KBY91_19150 [Streptomyces sp. RK23]|uniref:hypothetical protein n=1 Tax=unclassified Streptomyces TaxID=2593676 RepID=UPI001B3827BF|nr:MULTISPECIES: hypothetical protein [unclassified Streptomyces]MBQ0963468.1 hypothetical protein [Streptomyces sp. RK74B]MBQ1005524.1 hypothetical protein [Streptomyces sp. RK23]